MFLISYSHKFIFIHVYKVAGTSINAALHDYTHKPEELLLNRFLKKFGIKATFPHYRYRTLPIHITAKEARRSLPKKVYNTFYKFAFVRNPWDWQVSLYHFMLQWPEHFQHHLIKSMKDFDEYIEWRVNQDKHFQKDFVTDSDGNVIVDFIGRFENLQEDFQHICKVLNINASLPHLGKSLHNDYKSYYTEKTMKLVEEHFKEDIEFFEYTF